MNRDKIIFWGSTGLIAVMMLFSGYSYLTNDFFKEAFTHLGFPSYFRVELGIAKILAAVALIVPAVPAVVKQFTYHGLIITFISAFIAHLASGDPLSSSIAPMVMLVILLVSYYYANKMGSEAA